MKIEPVRGEAFWTEVADPDDPTIVVHRFGISAEDAEGMGGVVPVLVIPLTPESIEAMREKVVKAAYGPVFMTDEEASAAILAAIGITEEVLDA